MNSTRYVLIFVLTLTAVVAVMLTSLREATKTQAALNEEIFDKRAILKAVEDHLSGGAEVDDLSDDEVLSIFESNFEQSVIDPSGEIVDGMKAEDIDMAKEKKKPEEERVYPLYVYSPDESSDKFYIVSVRGNGLWDEIWGNIAFEEDLNTITGATFDHKGETPGLGAEIKDNPAFSADFKGTKIYRDGEYVSVTVRKGGARNETYEVDGISGATVTADGVTAMLYSGIKKYEPYFDKIRKK
ncbi:MAG: NADH:ubiquinone reductase (Na(+)-transporting) subunit C [Saprospiraceae bacterium]|nr:NADH:ubiquinone reductase (Na(+)-transporting) subunit C [Saprospiraceae bacterium]